MKTQGENIMTWYDAMANPLLRNPFATYDQEEHSQAFLERVRLQKQMTEFVNEQTERD